MDIPEIAAKPPKALCISGGGVRAHAAGVGVLRALTDMGLMDKFRYNKRTIHARIRVLRVSEW
eukprot:8279691-Prorocentrum_lima.AAC.1